MAHDCRKLFWTSTAPKLWGSATDRRVGGDKGSRRRFTVGAGGEFGGGAGGMGGDMEEGVDKVARDENLRGEETENSK